MDPMTDPRIEAAARAQYKLETGYDWEPYPGPERDARLAQAALVIAQVDAADDRVRLTLAEFNAIRADALSELGRGMRSAFDGAQYRALESAGAFDFIDERSAELSDGFIEPPDLHEAMASLIRERVGAELEKAADFLDAASLSDVAPDTEPDTTPSPGENTARLRRRVVNGCADWVRTRAGELRTGRVRLYSRVDTRIAVDEDQLTALRTVVEAEIDRAELMERDTNGALPAYILADRLREAVNAVTPNQNR